MAAGEQIRFVEEGVGRYLPFTVNVVGGTGVFNFVDNNGKSAPVSGRIYHRRVEPPNGAGSFVYYFQNGDGVGHDFHTVTGLVDSNDVALLVNETQFDIVNANGDGAYLVYL